MHLLMATQTLFQLVFLLTNCTHMFLILGVTLYVTLEIPAFPRFVATLVTLITLAICIFSTMLSVFCHTFSTVCLIWTQRTVLWWILFVFLFYMSKHFFFPSCTITQTAIIVSCAIYLHCLCCAVHILFLLVPF